MKRPARLLVPLALFALLAVLLARGLQLNPRELPSPLVGKPVPVLQLTALAGSPLLDVAALRDGRPTLLTVWASWCAPCREEQPVLMALSRQQPSLRLVGLGYKDEPAAARRWLTEVGNPFHAVGLDLQGQAGIELGVYGVPESFLIDGQGRIVFKHVGPLTAAVIETRIVPFLKGLRS